MTQTPDSPSPAPLIVEVTDGVAWLRLNRPDAMNSLDNALKDALVAALREVGHTIRDHDQFTVSLLPVGEGLLVAVKR